jgi:hypothetical protein
LVLRTQKENCSGRLPLQFFWNEYILFLPEQAIYQLLVKMFRNIALNVMVYRANKYGFDGAYNRYNDKETNCGCYSTYNRVDNRSQKE